MNKIEKRIDALFDELVPGSGKADTVAGEIIRAITRIAYRNYNDGDHVGIGYGKETCNPAARYLMEHCDYPVYATIIAMWGTRLDSVYSGLLKTTEEHILEFLDSHPELKTTPNTEDMWDYATEDDVDDYEDEEEDW